MIDTLSEETPVEVPGEDRTQVEVEAETSNSRPHLLIDVDGVLCPFQSGEDDYFSQHPVSLGVGGAVWVSEKNKDRLAQLAESFKLVWATAWEHSANEHLLEVHGLPAALPVIEFLSDVKTEPFDFYESWKMPWIRRYADKYECALAWIDDDIGDDAIIWAEDRTQTGIPTLVLPINPNSGLTDEHVTKLLQWAKN